MPPQDLLTISTIAFCAVLFLLALLAAIMRLITAVFPAKATHADAAMMAAVTSAYSALYPGATITTMEEAR